MKINATNIIGILLYSLSALFLIVFATDNELAIFNLAFAVFLATLGYGIREKRSRFATMSLIILGGINIVYVITLRFIGNAGNYLYEFILGFLLVLGGNWADRDIINTRQITSSRQTSKQTSEMKPTDETTQAIALLIVLLCALVLSGLILSN